MVRSALVCQHWRALVKPCRDIIGEKCKGKFKLPGHGHAVELKGDEQKLQKPVRWVEPLTALRRCIAPNIFAPIDKYPTHRVYIKMGLNFHNTINSAFGSLFGEEEDRNLEFPTAPQVAEWSTMQKLDYENQIAGIYISVIPLDDYLWKSKHLSPILSNSSMMLILKFLKEKN